MSLLMDALRKAELAKQHGASLVPHPTGSGAVLALEPMFPAPTHRSSQGHRPEAKERLAGNEKPAVPQVADDDARLMVRQAFAAKQPPQRSRRPVVLATAFAVLASASVGLYLWFQSQAARQVPGVPRGPVVVAAKSPPAPATPQPIMAALPSTPALPPDVSIPAKESRRAMDVRTPAPLPANAEPVPIRVAHARIQSNPDLANAFDALNHGDLEAALAGYAHVLTSEPRNVDALDGMASIALRQGHDDQAEKYYRRALEADPKDAVALAGLVGLYGHADPLAAESQLKTLLAAQPGQHVLHFALGNLHAAAGRWAEAQEAFFRAHTGDPEQPDYLFNLAVSLDRLHQPTLASRFYRQALDAASHRSAGFDPGQAETRLRELVQ